MLTACVVPEDFVVDKNTPKVENKHKGEAEFEAYLDRKKDKFKGKRAPNETLTTVDGQRYNLADLSGKVVLLNFWFAACKPCITEIPSLNELQSRFGNQEFLILSISVDKEELAKKIVKDKKIEYPVASNGNSLAKSMEVSTFPTSFLMDKNGIIREVFIGASGFDATYTYTEVKPHIERLLGKI